MEATPATAIKLTVLHCGVPSRLVHMDVYRALRYAVRETWSGAMAERALQFWTGFVERLFGVRHNQQLLAAALAQGPEADGGGDGAPSPAELRKQQVRRSVTMCG